MSINLQNLNMTCSPMYNTQNTDQVLGYICNKKERFENSEPKLYFKCPDAWTQVNEDDDNGKCSYQLRVSKGSSITKSESYNFGPKYGGFPVDRTPAGFRASNLAIVNGVLTRNVTPMSLDIRTQDLTTFDKNSMLNIPFNQTYVCPPGWLTQYEDKYNNGTCNFSRAMYGPVISRKDSFNFGPKYGGFPLNRRSARDRYNDLGNGSDQSTAWDNRSPTWDTSYTCPSGWKQMNEDTNNGNCSFTLSSQPLISRQDSFKFGPKYGGFPINRRSSVDRYNDLGNGTDQSKAWDQRIQNWDVSKNK
jgi:hypothetical protein